MVIDTGSSRPRVVIFATLVVFALLGAACEAPDSPDQRSEVVVTDSAGITIIDNGPLPSSAPAESLVPAVTIGVVEGQPEYQLFQVVSARRLADGAIALSNGGTRELRIYEADGTHRATAGGPGEGPGEFRYPSALVILPGDTIQVQDFLDRVYFSSTGEFLRQETGDRQALLELTQAAGGFSEGGGWLGDGSYFAPVYEPMQSPPRPRPLYRPTMTLVRVSSDLASYEVLGEFGGILQQIVEVGGPRPIMSAVPPFATNTNWTLGAADGTVVVGDNAHPQIDRFHPDGTRSIVRWSGAVERVSDAEVEEWKERQRTASWTQNQLPELERAWAAMGVPETKPHYLRVAAGSDGALWVTVEASEEGTTMRVFGPDGQFRRTVRLPGTFQVRDSGPGWVVGVLRDENEVEFVQVYELRDP